MLSLLAKRSLNQSSSCFGVATTRLFAAQRGQHSLVEQGKEAEKRRRRGSSFAKRGYGEDSWRGIMASQKSTSAIMDILRNKQWKMSNTKMVSIELCVALSRLKQLQRTEKVRGKTPKAPARVSEGWTLLSRRLEQVYANSDVSNVSCFLRSWNRALPTRIFNDLLDDFMKKLTEAKPLHVGQVLHSLVEQKSAKLDKAKAESIAIHLKKLGTTTGWTPQVASTALWSFDQLGHTLPLDTSRVLLENFLFGLDKANASQICRVLEVAANGKVDLDEDQLNRLVSRLVLSSHTSEATSSNNWIEGGTLSEIIWALGKIREKPLREDLSQEMLEMYLEVLSSKGKRRTSLLHISRALLAFVHSDKFQMDQTQFERICSSFGSRLKKQKTSYRDSPSVVANAVYAFGKTSHPLPAGLLEDTLFTFFMEQLPNAKKLPVIQVLVGATKRGVDIDGLVLPKLPPEPRRRAQQILSEFTGSQSFLRDEKCSQLEQRIDSYLFEQGEERNDLSERRQQMINQAQGLPLDAFEGTLDVFISEMKWNYVTNALSKAGSGKIKGDTLERLIQRMLILADDATPAELAKAFWTLGTRKSILPSHTTSHLLDLFLEKQFFPHQQKKEGGSSGGGTSTTTTSSSSTSTSSTSSSKEAASSRISSKDLLAKSICQILLSMAKTGFGVDAARLKILVTNLLPTFSESNSWVIANTIWALGEVKCTLPKETYGTILDAFVSKVGEASPIAVSQVLLGVAKKNLEIDGSTLESLVRHLLSTGDEKKDPQVMANTVWALGEIRTSLPKDMTRDVMNLFVEKLKEANPINISQVLLGLAKKNFHSTDRETIQLLVETFLSQAEARGRGTTTPQAIANSIWALGEKGESSRGFLSENLFARLLDLFMDELSRARPDDISQVLVGVAKKGFDIDREVLQRLIAHLLENYDPSRDQTAAGVSLWAVSKLKNKVLLPAHMIKALKSKARRPNWNT